jgi:cellobiose phosphorylase
LPYDPWFLLGNYRLTLFTHVSGNFQLITGQRAWGRLNQGSSPNTGSNSANIELRGDKGKMIKIFQLTGINSLAARPDKCMRVFGCGFADYTYQTDEIECKRTLSVKPSTNPYNGVSAFLVTLKFANRSGRKISFAYNESVAANYEVTQQQRKPPEKRMVRFLNTISINKKMRIIKADIRGLTDDPLQFPEKNEMSQLDGFPPHFCKRPRRQTGWLKKKKAANPYGRYELVLRPDEEKTIIIGYSFEGGFKQLKNRVTEDEKDIRDKNKPAAFRAACRRLAKSCRLQDETDKTLKRNDLARLQSRGNGYLQRLLRQDQDTAGNSIRL